MKPLRFNPKIFRFRGSTDAIGTIKSRILHRLIMVTESYITFLASFSCELDEEYPIKTQPGWVVEPIRIFAAPVYHGLS
jgi:hypothetical protein